MDLEHHLRLHAASFRSIRIIASLIRSAAVPWRGVFTAVRSAKFARWDCGSVCRESDAGGRRDLPRPPCGELPRWSGPAIAAPRRSARNTRECSSPLPCGRYPGCGQTERRLSVYDAEVYRFGIAPMLGGHHKRRYTEHFGRGARVDILAIAERIYQYGIVATYVPTAEVRSANSRRR